MEVKDGSADGTWQLEKNELRELFAFKRLLLINLLLNKPFSFCFSVQVYLRTSLLMAY